MSITKETILLLKRTDVSRDAEKTKQRVKEGFLSLRNKQKTEIVELSGLKRTSIYRVFREGSISAKITLAMAQILNVSPFYFTGETDQKEPLTDAQVVSFLKAKGYLKIADMMSEELKSENKQPNPVVPAGGSLFIPVFPDNPEFNEAVSYLREEDAITLLRALLIRGKAGGDAAQIADVVKRCLLV